jgi:hypothetical protein
MLEWRSCEQITCGKLQSVGCGGGGSQPYVLLFIQHMEESLQPLHTSSTKYTHTHTYIYV